MKRSVKDILNFVVESKDGAKIDIKDVLFDDETWMIRYLECDLGNVLNSRRVLIPQVLIKEVAWEGSQFRVELTRQDIENGPRPEDDKPVSRRYEEELNRHYNLIDYWASFYPLPGIGVATGMVYPPRPIRVPERSIDENKLDTNLRSFDEIKGYPIRALDEKHGRIDDLLIDDEDWQIVYAIIDTSSWFPWSKKVVVPIDILDEISYARGEVKVNLPADIFENAPEYVTTRPIDIGFERNIHDFFSQSQYKKAS